MYSFVFLQCDNQYCWQTLPKPSRGSVCTERTKMRRDFHLNVNLFVLCVFQVCQERRGRGGIQVLGIRDLEDHPDLQVRKTHTQFWRCLINNNQLNAWVFILFPGSDKVSKRWSDLSIWQFRSLILLLNIQTVTELELLYHVCRVCHCVSCEWNPKHFKYRNNRMK